MLKVYLVSRCSPWGECRLPYHGPRSRDASPTDPCGCFSCNQQRTRQLCQQIALAGHAVYAPHLFFTQFLDDALPVERAAGMAAGIEFLKCCDELWYDDRYGISSGMAAEIELARTGFEVCDLKLRRWKTVPVKTIREALGVA